jgi:signal transduction histidine kinase/CheY-like chemotaxis protein/HPt (histidine-containing phosphotransfer) domain-containing protein
MKIDFQRLATFALLFLSLCIMAQPASAQTAISQFMADNGTAPLQLPFFEDDSGTDSVIQAQVQLTRFEQGHQISPASLIHFNNAGGTYWINLHVTNNTSNRDWQIELPSDPNRYVTPVKSLALYDIQNPDKPIQTWLNTSLKPTLNLTIQPGETINRFILVKTWPGVQASVTPLLKTAVEANRQSVLLNRELSILWLVIGAVVGAGLVQLVLTYQPIQGVLAINGLLIGLAMYLLFRGYQYPQLMALHPAILPLMINGTLGILASITLMVAGHRQNEKAIIAIVPLLLSFTAIVIGIFYLDSLTNLLPLENLPVYILSATGLMLVLITMALGIADIGLFWFMPAWLVLMAMPWLSDEIPFVMPVAYAFLLAVAGVSSVFGYWHAMDRETEGLQRRLRSELRSSKEKYKEESDKWSKRMETERTLLTELKQREQQRSMELEVAKKEADAANKAKSDFLAIISHEIRTPMNGIMGILQIIEQTTLDHKQTEYLEIIKNSGDTMLTLLNDILDYSKIENGVIELEKIDFSLRKLVQSVATLMHGRSEAKGLNVIVDIDPLLPDIYSSDVGRIRQILLNLVSNAIKFTERGSVTIKVSKKSDDPFSLLFEIIDTGMGISEEGQSKLFQAYSQADASITRRFGGTGLGLNICRMLVNAMDGHLGVTSVEGTGSTFWFDLPLAIVNAANSELAKEIPSDYRPIKTLSVLVIDDNQVNLKIVSSLLEMDGHKVAIASGGERALQLIDQDRFDVVFVDMLMPEMDGEAFFARLRQNANPLRANMPVIALTGLASREDFDRILALGMRDVVVKPINQSALRHVINRLITEPEKGMEISLPDIMATLDNLSDIEKKELRAALKPAAKEKIILNMTMLKELKDSLPADTLKEIFSELIEKAGELTDALEKDLAAGDYANLGQNGHNIHGMAGNFGLQLLSEHSRAIEQAIREGQNEKAATLAKDSRDILNQSLEALDKWINS